jgi:hypothetical protein
VLLTEEVMQLSVSQYGLYRPIQQGDLSDPVLKFHHSWLDILSGTK